MSSAKATKTANEDIKPDATTKAYYKFNESGLLHTLCPPSHPKKPYYDGHPPSESLHEIWKNTVKVAVEAVLYPDTFNKKTDSMKDVPHYTSGRMRLKQKFYAGPILACIRRRPEFRKKAMVKKTGSFSGPRLEI
jgi:hypothetical protein